MSSPTPSNTNIVNANFHTQNKRVLVDRRAFQSEISMESYETTQRVNGWDCSFKWLATDARNRDLYEITRIAR